MNPAVASAVLSSQARCDAGDLKGALAVIEPHRGDLEADLQIASVAATRVFFAGGDASDVQSALAAHPDHPRALDLIGLAGYYAAVTSGSRDFGAPLGWCLRASRGTFESMCWRASNRFHIGLMQQAMGSHDLAVSYLEEAAAVDSCPRVRASAIRHLGMDADLRGDRGTARTLLDESLDIRRRHGIVLYLPFSLISSAEVSDDATEAARLLSEAVAVARSLGFPRPLALSLFHLGKLTGDGAALTEARDLAESIGHRPLMAALDEMN